MFWAINCFQCIMELLHIQRLNFFCFLAQPGVVYVSEPVLDFLTNIAVGSLTKLISSSCALCKQSFSQEAT